MGVSRQEKQNNVPCQGSCLVWQAKINWPCNWLHLRLPDAQLCLNNFLHMTGQRETQLRP